jgi:hypothetical protein
MKCMLCKSANLVEFPSEIAIHFPGRENLARPHVFAFPEIMVCLRCGSSRFTVDESELRLLQEGIKSSCATQSTTPAILSAANCD